jgi:hypothetical protein
VALRKFYVGTHGPYYYDDADLVDDPDGDFPAETRHAVLTDGPMKVEGVPVDGDHVLRLDDIPGAPLVLPANRILDTDALGGIDDVRQLEDYFKSTPNEIVCDGDPHTGTMEIRGGGTDAIISFIVALRNNGGVLQYRSRTINFSGGIANVSPIGNWVSLPATVTTFPPTTAPPTTLAPTTLAPTTFPPTTLPPTTLAPTTSPP